MIVYATALLRGEQLAGLARDTSADHAGLGGAERGEGAEVESLTDGSHGREGAVGPNPLEGGGVEIDTHQVGYTADAAGQVRGELLVAQGQDVGPVALGPPAGDVLRPRPPRTA